MNDNIDLSQDNPMPGIPGQGDDPNAAQYPQVTLENPDLVNLPNTGRSVIEHEVVSRTHEKNPQGHTHRVRIKIKSIRPMGRRKTTSNRPHLAENAMRGLMDEGI